VNGPVLGAVVLGAAYALLAVRERDRHGWRAWPTASFLAGCAVLACALCPALDRYADADFTGHMAQHLLLAMLAPLLLVLGAPVTLLLRSLPPRWGRALVRVLRSRPLTVLCRPWVALLLSSGATVAYYATPLYGASTRHAWLHAAVHLHFVASGYLFAWVLVGLDPGPARPRVPARLVVLGVAVAVHATAAQLLYAGLLVRADVPVAQLRSAGDLMYVQGDLLEVLLALALLLVRGPGAVRTARAVTGPAPQA